MTDANIQNPFAPPRAHVQDQYDAPPAEMVLATRVSRLLAYFLDFSPFFIVGIVAALMLPGVFTGTFDPKSSNMVGFGLVMIVFFLVLIGWFVWNIVLTYRYGQSIGKKLLGIRVVRMDGSRVTFARFFFLRWLAMAVIGGVFGAIVGAFHVKYAANLITVIDCVMIFGTARRCLHDLVADTKVVTAASSPNARLYGATAR